MHVNKIISTESVELALLRRNMSRLLNQVAEQLENPRKRHVTPLQLRNTAMQLKASNTYA